jgi:hypothetical protein
MDQTRGLNIFF